MPTCIRMQKKSGQICLSDKRNKKKQKKLDSMILSLCMEMTCVGLKDDMALIKSDLFLYENDTFLFESEVFLFELKRLGACFGHVFLPPVLPPSSFATGCSHGPVKFCFRLLSWIRKVLLPVALLDL